MTNRCRQIWEGHQCKWEAGHLGAHQSEDIAPPLVVDTAANMRLAKRIVQAIWHDLNDRKGIRHVLSDIEDDTPEIYKEIQDDLNKLVYAVLTQGGKETYAISELGLLRVKTYREGDHLVIGLKCPCCTIRQEFIGEYTKNIYGPGEPKRVVAYCTVCGYEACVTATLDPEEE